MRTRGTTTRRSRAGAGVAAVAITGVTLAALPTAAAQAAPASTGGDCRLVELAAPAGGYDAGVMDIEVVDGRTTYYGNYHVRDDEGREHQRAVIWRGLGGVPEPLDPGLGGFADIAFELTETGLVNGVSEDEDQGNPVPWVMDLRSGKVTVVDTAAGSATDRSRMYVRRINDAGAVVGSDAPGRGANRNERALGWDHFTAQPFRLDSSASLSSGWGINNLGDRTGFIGKDKRPGYPHWTDYTPMVWHADGTSRELPRAGIDAIPSLVKDDRTAAGDGWWGWSVEEGHVEAMLWPSFDEVVGLGVVEGGGWSRVFGLDEGGWAVGMFDQFTEPSALAPDGVTAHGFLYRHGVTQSGHVRVLPSLRAVADGVTDWHEWHGSAVHAVNGELDQAASSSHNGFDGEGRPTWGATVWVNASSCGVEVATTHDPWHLTDLESAREASTEVGQRN